MDETMILLGIGAVIAIVLLVFFMRGELKNIVLNDLSAQNLEQAYGKLEPDEREVYTSSTYTKGADKDDESDAESLVSSEDADEEKTEDVSIVLDNEKPLGASKNFSSPYSMNREPLQQLPMHMQQRPMHVHHLGSKWDNPEDAEYARNKHFGIAKQPANTSDLRHHRAFN